MHPRRDLGGLGRGPQVALTQRAAQRQQRGPLGVGLDTFGHALQAQLARQVDHVAADRGTLAMPVDIDNERPVELQLRERQVRQQLERGDANAEIVDRHAIAQQPQAVHRDRQGQRIGHRIALGQLHRQRLARHAAGGHQGIKRLQHTGPAQVRADALMPSAMWMPAARSRNCAARHWRVTKKNTGSAASSASSRGIKMSGCTRPCSGWRQRTSASARPAGRWQCRAGAAA